MMAQVRIQKLWRGHMTRWTQIMELATSYDGVPPWYYNIVVLRNGYLQLDSVLKTRKKVRRKREEELIFIGMVSKTSVELILTQWQWQMTKMNINQMLPDFSLKMNINQIEFCTDASSRVLDRLSKQAWADLRISTGTPGGWKIWDSVNQIEQITCLKQCP